MRIFRHGDAISIWTASSALILLENPDFSGAQLVFNYE